MLMLLSLLIVVCSLVVVLAVVASISHEQHHPLGVSWAAPSLASYPVRPVATDAAQNTVEYAHLGGKTLPIAQHAGLSAHSPWQRQRPQHRARIPTSQLKRQRVHASSE